MQHNNKIMNQDYYFQRMLFDYPSKCLISFFYSTLSILVTLWIFLYKSNVHCGNFYVTIGIVRSMLSSKMTNFVQLAN